MQEEIERVLLPLIGLPLTDMWRYAGHQKFEFGVQRAHKNRRGEEVTWADWGLVVACHWRITSSTGIVVSSKDFGPGKSRRDEAAYPFYEMLEDAPHFVEAIRAADDGAVCFRMTDEYTLEVWPDGEPNEEQWRFMPKDGRRRHFVVTSEGIQR